MKKRTLLLTSLVFLAIVVFAQNKEWNFSEEVWRTTILSDGATVEGLTVYSTNSKATTGASNKTHILNDVDYTFTHCFKFGETGSFEEDYSPITGILSFDVIGDSEISVVGAHASSSGEARELVVSAGNEDGFQYLGSFLVYQKNDEDAPEGLKGSLNSATYSYVGGPATIYVYSAIGGVNLFLVKTEGEEISGVNTIDSQKSVSSIEYFDVLGNKLSKEAVGLVIEKVTYIDGSTSAKKIWKQ